MVGEWSADILLCGHWSGELIMAMDGPHDWIGCDLPGWVDFPHD